MRTMNAIVLITWSLSAVAMADEVIQKELKEDVVLRALVDELERGKAGLLLDDLERPYFIEYTVVDSASASVSADLGAVSYRATDRSRDLSCETRVGSYVLDNTNFRGGGSGTASLPIEDDYTAIRQSVWWATDRQYKDAVEEIEQKRAFMEGKVIEDKPDDFSHEEPTTFFEPRTKIAIDQAQLERLAIALSAVFKQHPDIQNSSVNVSGLAGNRYLVNSEGTRLRVSGSRFWVSVSAMVQADDGMEFNDDITVFAEKFEELPSADELTKRCRKMIDGLIALKIAPTLEAYTGPVLFDAEPATTVFASRFARNFGGGQRPVGSRTSPDDFEKKLNQRVLPRFINVVDDPTAEKIADIPVLANYEYDTQGVKAQAVTLVEKGKLLALLMARNPSKASKNSNGHGRGGYTTSGMPGCIIVTSADGADEAALRQELTEACADEGLEFGIRVASLGSRSITPLMVFKVFPDGREELVRGLEIARFDLKAFKRMLAAGDTPHVWNTGWLGGTTIAAPSMLFEELDLAKADRDFDKPPFLPSPLARTDDKGK